MKLMPISFVMGKQSDHRYRPPEDWLHHRFYSKVGIDHRLPDISGARRFFSIPRR